MAEAPLSLVEPAVLHTLLESVTGLRAAGFAVGVDHA
jgi:hypothetical protein